MNKNCYDKIICHNAVEPFPLPDNCIDVVITSPPYWGLRDYGVEGQIGLEPHPQLYIDKIVDISLEIKRVLKKKGSFYLNLGDTYFGSGTGQKVDHKGKMTEGQFLSAVGANEIKNNCKPDKKWLQPKQLMLIPSRIAIAFQEKGWILRNDIIWHKPNPMPSSVKDRLNNTYEHIFHFVKSKKYYYNLDNIREPHKSSSIDRYKYTMDGCYTPGNAYPNEKREKPQKWNLRKNGKNPGDVIKGGAILGESGKIKVPGGKGWTKKIPGGGARCEKDPRWCSPNGKNPGDVIRNKPINKILNMRQSPEPIENNAFHENGKNPGDFFDICTQPFTSYNQDMEHFAVFPEELVEKPLRASCPSGGVVLDPFGGRGTVCRVAKKLGFHWIMFDLNQNYCELAYLYINGQKRKLIENQYKLEM